MVCYTNHAPLMDLHLAPGQSARWQRWLKALAEFDLCIQYIARHNNTAADALSRPPVTSQDLHDMEDPQVNASLQVWLKRTANHLQLHHCIEAASASLQAGRPLMALSCKKCGRMHLDAGSYATH